MRPLHWGVVVVGALIFVAVLSLHNGGVSAENFAGVLTWHNDNARTGQNLTETILTHANVNANQFGRLLSYSVDGVIYGQPLYVPNLAVSGATHNVVFVVTEHDSVYAFDADGLSTAPLWHVSFIDPPAVTTMPCTNAEQPGCDPTTIAPERGITATPVIDPVSGTIYVVAKTVENGTYTYKLHALDVSRGAERSNSPAVIQASAPGHPDAIFHPVQALDRSGLVYANGEVLISFASSDSDRGWLMAYDGANLTQTAVFCVTPTGTLGAIWGSGAAPAVDSTGNIYFMTGNGTFDAGSGGENYSMSMLKLTPHGNRFRVTDYFTPHDQEMLSAADYDLASGGVVLLPDQPGPHKHEITGGSKTGQVFIVDRDNMGKFDPNDDHIVQVIQPNTDGFWSTPAYFHGKVYWAAGGNPVEAFSLENGQYILPAASQGSKILRFPGATPSISANGTQDGIVWILASLSGDPPSNAPAALLAYDAENLSHELYSSRQIPSRDQAGPAVKFAVPTVAQGKVYVGTKTELDIYGLLQ